MPSSLHCDAWCLWCGVHIHHCSFPFTHCVIHWLCCMWCLHNCMVLDALFTINYVGFCQRTNRQRANHTVSKERGGDYRAMASSQNIFFLCHWHTQTMLSRSLVLSNGSDGHILMMPSLKDSRGSRDSSQEEATSSIMVMTGLRHNQHRHNTWTRCSTTHT